MKARFLAIHPVLMASDVSESVRFYCTLGFSLAFQDQAVEPRYAGVVRDGIELHIQWADSTQWNYPTDRPAYRFLVADVDAIYREFVASGSVNAATSQGSPWSSPSETPWGTREFHLRDPGAEFATVLPGATGDLERPLLTSFPRMRESKLLFR